ncbi:MAG: ribosome silencing factor [Verrucomicrobiota bacterium]|nr:MAG: ribosome silencing factor [Verrucomicrobiota bacterium]
MSVNACGAFLSLQSRFMQKPEQDLLRICVQIAEDKKCEELKIFDVHGISGIADYILLATCNSEAHLRALGSALYEVVKHRFGFVGRIDYQPQSGWFVLDAFDLIAHLVTHEVRSLYRLDKLWERAPVLLASDFPVDFKAETAAYTA